MPPRVSKSKKAAAVAATPRRVTRNAVRAGSATLEEQVEIPPTPSRRRGRSRSVTPTQEADSSLPPQQLDHLPVLAEEEEKQPSPRITTPHPIDFAPIVEASPYITPRQHLQNIAPSPRSSPHKSPALSSSVSRSVNVLADNNDIENDDPVQAQIAAEVEEAGLSILSDLQHKRKSLDQSIASHKRRSIRAAGALLHPLDRSLALAPLSPLHTPLSHVSGNVVVSPMRTSFDTPPYLSSPDSLPFFPSMNIALESPGYYEQLTGAQRLALVKDMRAEIIRLRSIEQQYLAASKSSARATSSPQSGSSPEVPRTTMSRRRDLRYQMSIAKPAAQSLAARKAAEAEAAAAASAEAALQSVLDQTPSRSSFSRSSASSAEQQRRKSNTSQNNTSTTQTPQKSSQANSPAETPSASPGWGLSSLFGSVRSIFAHRPSPTKRQDEPVQQESEEQAHVPTQQSPTPKHRSSAVPGTPTPLSREPKSALKKSVRKTPAERPAEIAAETPAKTPTRRRGFLPGSLRTPRTRDTPRQKPKEVNADLRAQQLDQAAEQAAERKRIQDQANRIEQERRKAEEEQKKRDDEDAALQKAGSKRKRVRIDDLAVIPCKRPGQGTGSFGLIDEFFDYNSDEEDDYVEMDEDQIHYRSAQRSPKKARLDDNVFQPKAPAVQSPAISPVKQGMPPASVPATPLPNYSQVTQQAIEKQRLQFSQHKPKQPSRLRNVERLSTGSTIASPNQTLLNQPITAAGQPIIAPAREIISPPQDLAVAPEQISPTPQPTTTPPKQIFEFPPGEDICSPETWARIDKWYTKEMQEADFNYYLAGFQAATRDGYP